MGTRPTQPRLRASGAWWLTIAPNSAGAASVAPSASEGAVTNDSLVRPSDPPTRSLRDQGGEKARVELDDDNVFRGVRGIGHELRTLRVLPPVECDGYRTVCGRY